MTKQGRPTPVVVEPKWLLQVGVSLVLFALVCGYLTFCVLFYQGQWQLMLHPVRTAERPATIEGASYQAVRFGPDASGVPQRTGWWMPALPEARYRHLTLLVLPSGEGSLVGSVATLAMLREAGVNVFAIDYRGFGASAAVHPSEERMREDAEAAWHYLTAERQVAGSRIVPYGMGLGAVMALDLAERHGEVPALVLDGPRFDMVQQMARDPRVRLLPVSLLLKDRFALEPQLTTLRTPKLLITHAAEENRRALNAGDPKMTVALPSPDMGELERALQRFLDMYAPPTPMEQLPLPKADGGSR